VIESSVINILGRRMQKKRKRSRTAGTAKREPSAKLGTSWCSSSSLTCMHASVINIYAHARAQAGSMYACAGPVKKEAAQWVPRSGLTYAQFPFRRRPAELVRTPVDRNVALMGFTTLSRSRSFERKQAPCLSARRRSS
jgi:hypothetical protein